MKRIKLFFKIFLLIIIIFSYFILVSCSHGLLNPIVSDQQESKSEDESTTNTISLTISKLEANPVSVAMGKNVTLSVIVSYSGQSQLSYKWEQSGSNVIWTAPVGLPCCVPGPYPITVTVDDGNGNKPSKTITVQVTL